MSELDALTRLAFLGTVHATEPGELGGVEGRTLRALGELPLERRVLLAAGARGVARAAGSRPARLESSGEACPPETREECSPRVSRALADSLEANNGAFAQEILERIARARLRIPPVLLPRVFGLGTKGLADSLDALGERGRWLARLNPQWRSLLSAAASTPEDVERVWSEGTFAERQAVLERVRHAEPARARQLLQGTFVQEKADHRARFLQGLSPGLSLEDESFLESGLKDRAAGVRDAARELLAQLPASGFSRRMETRAREVLQRTDSGAFQLEFPAKWDAEAERDGLDKPPTGTGPRAHWLHRLLSAVPLSTWERAFAATPEQLVAAAARSEDGVEICVGWNHAARLGVDSAWVSALLDYWTRIMDKAIAPPELDQLARRLIEALPGPERAAQALRVIRGTQALPPIGPTLASVPTPWPEELALAWLEQMRTQYTQKQWGARTWELFYVLNLSAKILPDTCLEAFTQPIELPPLMSQWQQQLKTFQAEAALRRILHEELKP